MSWKNYRYLAIHANWDSIMMLSLLFDPCPAMQQEQADKN
jgi:hypothetical protein